jgi:NADPH:quinone reductase-like Zn-dependent oxidoreductase
MRAAVLDELGGTPRMADVPEPEVRDGDVLVRVRAATINPVDLSISRGGFYRGEPEVPYVVGNEGVGEVDGKLHYFEVGAGFDGRGGTLAELVAVPRESLVELPDGADPALVVGFGIAGLAAWLGLEWTAKLQQGERVLILGASGPVGQVGVQAAKLLGAAKVVAAARSEDGLRRAAELGADTTVGLGRDDTADRLRAEGEFDVTLDPLWGEPALAALAALAPFGRHVQLGQSAGAEAAVPSAVVRGRARQILGHTNFLVPHGASAAAYRRMVDHSVAGELTVDHETMPLDRAPEAWERQQSGPHCKLVLVP